jgi:hypothetical protein
MVLPRACCSWCAFQPRAQHKQEGDGGDDDRQLDAQTPQPQRGPGPERNVIAGQDRGNRQQQRPGGGLPETIEGDQRSGNEQAAGNGQPFASVGGIGLDGD